MEKLYFFNVHNVYFWSNLVLVPRFTGPINLKMRPNLTKLAKQVFCYRLNELEAQIFSPDHAIN